MRFGVIGLGSMGKRRVRDLAILGHEVIGFDIRTDRNKQAREMFGIGTVRGFEELLRKKPDALVISTPPDQHLTYYDRSFAARLPFFSEANILTPTPDWFAAREAKSGVRGYPSGTWKFHPLFSLLRRQLLEIGLDHVNTVHYQYGGYLPLWHPWERYDKFYAGRSRHTGAAREMVPFEMEWLAWLFGPLRAVCAVNSQRAKWSTAIDDSYLMLIEFESGLCGSIMVELHQVAPFRIGRVSCSNHSFTLDLASHELKRYEKATDSWRYFKPPGMRTLGSFDFEQIYMAEIKAFVGSLRGDEAYPKTWSEDRHLSDFLYAAEESWRRREWVAIEEVKGAYDGRAWVKV
jgi:predicted dehydrogenase